MSTVEEAKPPIRRRERGERRICQIIDAAAEVLVERGYEGASTNAIAEHAGISPGSLYQFFRNKEEIAEALALRYASAFGQALDEAFMVEVADLPTERMVDRIVDALIAVNLANPALSMVFRGDAPPALAEAIKPLENSILERVLLIVALRVPDASVAEQRRLALVTVAMFRALAPLALRAPAGERPLLVIELKRALASYISAAQAASGRATG